LFVFLLRYGATDWLRDYSATQRLHFEEAAMEDEVERETVVPTTPEEAWQAVVESDWLGRIDPTPGGEVECGDRTGFVEEVEAPRRLSFWWGAEGEDATRVEIELSEDEDGTRVRVIETRPLAVLDAYGSDLGAAIGAPQGPQLVAV
jgi:uncharacterized protein YndB with AHSA1/START domain